MRSGRSPSPRAPFAYENTYFSPLFKERRFQNLFDESFLVAFKETDTWKPLVDRRVDREARNLKRKENNIAYLVDKMENCDNLQYDPTLSIDENLK